MDIDLGIVAATIAAGREGLKALSDAKITSDMIADDKAKSAFDFIRVHAREHGSLPTAEFLQAKLGVVLPEVKEPLSVYIKEVSDRSLWQRQAKLSKMIEAQVGAKKPAAVDQALEEYQRESRRTYVNAGTIESVFSSSDGVVKAYEDAKAGVMGVRTPWPSINTMTRGALPGDLWVFAARLGTGKTWALLQMANQAYKDGYQVLFISPEMHRTKLAMRFLSLHLGFPYADIRHGRLNAFNEPVFRQRFAEVRDLEGFDVMGSGVRYTTQIIEDAVALCRPDVVFVDGMYLVRGPGKNRSEMVAAVTDDLKLLAGHYSVPIIGSTQFNREVKRNDVSTVDIANIGLTDVMGWDADAVFALVQTDDHRTDREMLIKPLKVREGDDLHDVLMRWDFREMLFAEMGNAENEYHDADYQRYAKPDGEAEPGPAEGGPDGAIPF